MADVTITIKFPSDKVKPQVDNINKQFSRMEKNAEKAVRKNIEGVQQLVINAQTRLRKFDLFLADLGARFAAAAISNGFRLITTSVLEAVQAAIDFEKQLVSVQKTTDLTNAELREFGKSIQQISARIPVSTERLLELATAAGQLGVSGSRDLLKFAETVAKLGVATDLQGEDAAKTLARILEITKEGAGNIENLANVIVDLGNNFAASESEIARMTTKVALATAAFNVSSAEAVALGTAMKALGINAELGGSSVNRAFIAISKSISGGGSQLEALVKLTKLTGNELKKTFAEDSVKVFRLFLKGLNTANEAGTTFEKTLAQFSLTGVRTLSILPVLAKRTDLLADAVKRAKIQQEGGNALNEEAARAFGTTSAQLKITSNRVTILAQQIGDKLLPVIRSGNLLLQDFIDLLSEDTSKFTTDLAKNTEEIRKLDDAIADAELRLRGFQNIAQTKEEGGFLGNLFKAFNKGSQDDIKRVVDELVRLGAELDKAKKSRRELLAPGEGGGEGEPPSPPPVGESPEVIAKRQRAEFLRQLNLQELDDEVESITLKEEVRTEFLSKQLEQDLAFVDAETEIRRQGIRESIDDTVKQKLAIEKLDAEATKRRLSVIKTAAKAERQLSANKQRAIVGIAQSTANLVTSATEEGSKAAFVAQKAAALAGAIVASNLAQAQALATPPPGNIALVALTKLQGRINIAAIIASAIKGFQDGGILGGNSSSGDKLVFRGNTGEMMLNKPQQAELFAMANGQQRGDQQREIVVHSTVILDEEVVGRAVSKQVNDGLVLGEVT